MLDPQQAKFKRNTKREYLLRGVVSCRCQRRWTGIYKKDIDRGYYRCTAKDAEPWLTMCDMPGSIRQDVLEPVVWQHVTNFLLNPDMLRAELDARKQRATIEIAASAQRLQAVHAALADIERPLALLLDQLHTNGFAQSVIDQRKHDLVRRREELLDEVQRIESVIAAQIITPEHATSIVEFAAHVRQGCSMDAVRGNAMRWSSYVRADMFSLKQIQGKITIALHPATTHRSSPT